jgi:hypothetical protein
VAKPHTFFMRFLKDPPMTFFESDSKCDFSNAIFGQIRQRAVGLIFYSILFCCPTKEGGLSARRLA